MDPIQIHAGEAQCALGGGGGWPFCSIVHLYGEKNCALRDKSITLSMVIVLTLLNKIGYGPRRICFRGENFALRGWGAI